MPNIAWPDGACPKTWERPSTDSLTAHTECQENSHRSRSTACRKHDFRKKVQNGIPESRLERDCRHFMPAHTSGNAIDCTQCSQKQVCRTPEFRHIPMHCRLYIPSIPANPFTFIDIVSAGFPVSDRSALEQAWTDIVRT